MPYDYATTLNKGHGRIERRECWAISDPSCLGYLSTGGDWPGLRSVVRVVGRRDTDTGATAQARYYMPGQPSGTACPLEHHSLHSLDVTFDHGPQNMATLRQTS